MRESPGKERNNLTMRRPESSFYKASEGEPLTQRAREQEALLRKIFVKAADVSSAVRAALRTAEISPSSITLKNLERLPLLRKEQLPTIQAEARPFGGWLGVPVGELKRIFVSPGPIYDPEGDAQDYWGFAPALHAAGFRQGMLVLNTFSYHLTPAGAMFDGALAALGCVTIPSGVGNLETQLKTMVDLGATGFVGTPSFLATLVDKAVETRTEFPLRVAFVSGEPLAESQRHDLETRTNMRISQGYAVGDLGLIAYECPKRTGLHFDDRVIVELVDESGARAGDEDVGEVVVTFLNPVYPLLRLATGDLSQMAKGPCPCGRTAPRLAAIMGRRGEGIKVRGLFLYPHDLHRALARHPEVRRYQAIITRPERADELTIRVESEVEDRQGLAVAIAQSVLDATRLQAEVEVIRPGAVWVEDKTIVDRRKWD